MRTGLSVDEAQRAILAATPVLGPETVPVRDALGRVLAEGVLSTRTLPPADCSAMDGYAVRRSDLVGASAGAPKSLVIAPTITGSRKTTSRICRSTASITITSPWLRGKLSKRANWRAASCFSSRASTLSIHY